jgi:hypothetical protein
MMAFLDHAFFQEKVSWGRFFKQRTDESRLQRPKCGRKKKERERERERERHKKLKLSPFKLRRLSLLSLRKGH